MERILDMKEAMLVLEDAFREWAKGGGAMPTRASLSIAKKEGWLGVMPAFLEGQGSLSTKIVTVFNQNPSINLTPVMATIVLNSPDTGEVVSVMEGTYATAIRTGALGGLAAKYLSRSNSRVVGIYGAGTQARTQLMAVSGVRDISGVRIYDPTTERAEALAREAEDRFRVDVDVCPTSADCVTRSDIIIAASTSKVPLFDGRLVRPGTHINAFGSFRPDERELDTETIKRSKVFVDLREAALAEAGDLIIPIHEGAITPDHILADFGQIVSGSAPGRKSPDDVTVFKSVGLGIQDCAIASLAYSKAKRLGVGTEVGM